MRIAFYAPLKPPTHAVPSGDRRMARLLLRALEEAGHAPFLASEFRSYEGRGDGDRQAALHGQAEAERDRLLRTYRGGGRDRPQAWFTYHPYHKAPDWLGPAISDLLDIPYLVAEPSFAPKRADGPWRLGHGAAAAALARADIALCLTRHDMACVAPRMRQPERRLMFLPPFLDTGAGPQTDRAAARGALAGRLGLDENAVWLAAVAMMRAGDKLASYRQLGAALARLDRGAVRLLVAGDGAARPQVEAALRPLGEDVRFLGELGAAARSELLAAADLYVWPAVGEAYGMALLEAQAAGLPVVAGRAPGVVDVVEDGRSGLLAAPGDPAALAARVAELVADPARRRRLGAGARAFIAQDRTLAAAAARLRQAIERARALRAP